MYKTPPTQFVMVIARTYISTSSEKEKWENNKKKMVAENIKNDYIKRVSK
jgi:hypothetical protein